MSLAFWSSTSGEEDFQICSLVPFFQSIAPLLKNKQKQKNNQCPLQNTYEECFVPNFVEICLVLLEKRWKCNLEENRKISNRKIMSHRLRWAKKSQSIFILICLLKRIWIFSSVFKSKNFNSPFSISKITFT